MHWVRCIPSFCLYFPDHCYQMHEICSESVSILFSYNIPQHRHLVFCINGSVGAMKISVRPSTETQGPGTCLTNSDKKIRLVSYWVFLGIFFSTYSLTIVLLAAITTKSDAGRPGCFTGLSIRIFSFNSAINAIEEFAAWMGRPAL